MWYVAELVHEADHTEQRARRFEGEWPSATNQRNQTLRTPIRVTPPRKWSFTAVGLEVVGTVGQRGSTQNRGTVTGIGLPNLEIRLVAPKGG